MGLAKDIARYQVKRSKLMTALFCGAMLMGAAPLYAQQSEPSASSGSEAEASAGSVTDDDRPAPINLTITVPRGEVNEAQSAQCEARADAGTISGEIVVCRQIAQDGANFVSNSRAEAQKRYAQETAFKDAPAAPNVSGLGDHGNAISIGGVPPPALIIDVEALPDAPAGSDADRIARGLPPLNQDDNLSEDEIRSRREALGLSAPERARP